MDSERIRDENFSKNNFTQDNKMFSATGVGLSTVQRIPPEVWELVFDNLEESTDMLNASHAVNIWNTILHPTKKTWLFVQILPLLLEYLSKKDVFNCRLVCPKWCSAVDHFLTQNSFHRPASSEPGTQLIEKRTNQYKTDNRINPIDNLLRQLDLRYNAVNKLKDIAHVSSLSPDNTVIVGRSAIVAEERKNVRTPINQPTNIQFLQQFGSQIQFFRITFDNLDYFFDVIKYLPNLKKLDFVYLNPCLTREQLNQQISNLSTTRPISVMRSLFPKSLETLRIYMMKDDQYALPQFLLSLVAEQLGSLTITAATPPPTQQVFNRLVDLSIVIRENRHWDFFKCLVQCPIRRLLINVNGNLINVKPMQVILTRFQESLRNLEIHFTDEVKELKYNQSHYQVFAQERLELPNLLRLTFKDNLPPSLNFVFGIKSLQYLHFIVGRHAKGEVRKQFKAVHQRMINREEELDLLKILYDILAAAEEQIDWDSAAKYIGRNIQLLYESIVWSVFPKLRVLTVLLMVRVNSNEGCTKRFNCYEKTKEYELRRDIFEKMQEQKLKKK